jgi:hypothetical protein
MSHEAEYAALVGIDWADTKHDFCLRATGAEQEEYGVMGHLPEAIDQWAKGLAARFPGRTIAVFCVVTGGRSCACLSLHECAGHGSGSV